jgi:hypothetical protein
MAITRPARDRRNFSRKLSLIGGELRPAETAVIGGKVLGRDN